MTSKANKASHGRPVGPVKPSNMLISITIRTRAKALSKVMATSC